MADKAYITPKVLKWARESARISEDTAASKVSVPVEKLLEWEDGSSQPTINQAEKLAKAYKRPFALFFLPDIPRDFQPLQDFRRNTAKPIGTASVFIIREIQQKQAWIKELLEENKDKPLPFVGRFTVNSSPKEVAADILRTLEINPAKYLTCNVIKEWIDKAESKGIFVSRTSFIHSRLTLDTEEIQGFAIADPYAPFVFVNSKDWGAPQLFTLFHEIAHIWIAASGVSNEIEMDMQQRDKLHPIELFCNQVAANALMPETIMNSYSPAIFDSSKSIFKVAKNLGVSSYAFIVRSLNLQLISLASYNRLKKEIEKDFNEFLQKEEEKKLKQKKTKGGPNYFLLQLNKNGRLFTQIVLDAFRGGFIEPTQASNLLNTKANKFSNLESIMNL